MSFQVISMQPRTLSWWRDERSDIDLDPSYQRKGHVWSDSQKQYLIDSIINGFDIPKLYFADFTFLNSELNSNKKKYAVIDGKQRLLAIFDFFDDKLTLPRGFLYREDPNLSLSGFSYSDLSANYPRIARKFDNASLTIMSVITDDESEINELFVRLNSSKPLTGAELRGAMGGRLPVIVNDLVSHSFFTSRISFSTARSQDKNEAAKLLLLEHRGSIVDTKKGQLDALVSEGFEQEADGIAPELAEALDEVVADTENVDIGASAKRVRKHLDKLERIFLAKDMLLKQQSQVVMIYWLVRDLEPSLLVKVRPFLLKFEEDRVANRGLHDAERDSALSEYELMARTSNDAYSIRKRDQILRARFKEFIA